MAEIKVVRRGPGAWPLLLGLVALALLAWGLIAWFDRAPALPAAPLAEPAATPPPS